MEIDNSRFYIFDCNGKMIGNPFGYKTHGSAMAQTSKVGTVSSLIRRARNQRKIEGDRGFILFSIKIGELVKEARK
jgi:hypothetical protein